MTRDPEPEKMTIPRSIDVSDEDIYDAMKEIPGYLDITPGDFKEVYRLAYRRAFERLIRSVKALDVMTREVVFVTRGTPLKEVAEAMAGHGIAGVPVLGEGGRVEGVISEKDFLRHMGAENVTAFMGVVSECLKGRGCLAAPVRAKKAEDIMTSPAVTIKEDLAVMEIANIFSEKKINRVPVVDEEGRLKGIVSRADIIQQTLLIKDKGEHPQ